MTTTITDGLIEDLTELRKIKYSGDCKCGNCQLIPLDLLDRTIAVLTATTGRCDECSSPKACTKTGVWKCRRARPASAGVGEEVRKALEFYQDSWGFKTLKGRAGLEWFPKEELLDDCGERAKSALSLLSPARPTPCLEHHKHNSECGHYYVEANTGPPPMTTEGPITSFMGEYRWLSNFHLVPITMNGITFTSTEAAYQAMKSTHRSVQNLFATMTPREAKRASRHMRVRSDWDRMKLSIMTIVTDQKFRDPALRTMLLATGDRELIEGNTWNDTFWGQCPLGVGENHLGKIIMARRAAIRRFE